ncbi:unnamed protein product [Anisakis simplex]|uniref:Uncharacterized protein n=1 Tax=Anisakis simplex TaxID=6269 RepID=A0A0M3J1Q3_ANISI|nr:unnamed protein product [Anisakis simplex]
MRKDRLLRMHVRSLIKWLTLSHHLVFSILVEKQ